MTEAHCSKCEITDRKRPLGRRVLEAVGLIVLVALFWRFIFLPLGRLLPSISTGSSLAAMFGLGVVASVSTCLAATGAFLLAYTAEGKTRAKVVWVHTGRLTMFVLGGGLLGAIGGALPNIGGFYGVIALGLGVGFLVVGLHLLDLAPSLTSLGIRLPSGAAKFVDGVTQRKGKATPLLVGAATFILPCGFTQTAQALALASGSAGRGALLLAAFALGTFPVLFGLTVFGSSGQLKSRTLKLAAGAILVVFAFLQIDGGLAVLGSPVTLGGLFGRASATAATDQTNEQVIKMEVAYGTFRPNSFTLKKGVPVRWEIQGTDIAGCASTIVVPRLGIKRVLVPGLQVVNFVPQEIGEIPFSCQMGMIRGSFNVVN